MENNKYSESTLIDMYRICVESANSISERRHYTNVYMMSIHSAVISIVVFFFDKVPITPNSFVYIIPFMIMILFCYTWFRLIKSYGQLNSAKFKVIGELEKNLPYSPLVEMEWKMLGEGKNKKLYTPFTTIEKNIPILIGIIYLGLAIMIVLFK